MPFFTNESQKNPTVIQDGKDHLILCEGSDDELFLNCYLGSAEFSSSVVNSIQVSQFCGKDNLRNMLKVFANAEGFLQLKSLLIIRDADDNIISARDSVKGAFESINLPAPSAEYEWNCTAKIKTGFLLMPSCSDNSQTGALEDLCWKILTEKHGAFIHEEVEQFLASLEHNKKRVYSHKNKALIHTYFSATDDLIAASIGRAARAGAFNWKSPELHALHEFIIKMLPNDTQK